MASTKDTFESNTFASNTFASGAFRGTGVAVSNVTGPAFASAAQIWLPGAKKASVYLPGAKKAQ